MKYIITLFLLLIFSSCKTYKVDCPPTRIIHKDANNVWPVYGKTFDASIKGILKILSEDASGDISLKNEIITFRDKLSNEYAIVQDFIKARYTSIQGNPCSRESWETFNNALDDLSEKNFELEKLKIKLKNQKENGTKGANDDIEIKKIISQFNNSYKYSISD